MMKLETLTGGDLITVSGTSDIGVSYYNTVAPIFDLRYEQKDGAFGVAGGFRANNELSSLVNFYSLFNNVPNTPNGWYSSSSPYIMSTMPTTNGIASELYSRFCQVVKSWKFRKHFRYIEDFLGWEEMLRLLFCDPIGAGYETAFFAKPMDRLGQRLFCLRNEDKFMVQNEYIPWESRYWYFGYRASLPIHLDLFYLDMETRKPGMLSLLPPAQYSQFTIVDTRWAEFCLGILSHATPLLGDIAH